MSSHSSYDANKQLDISHGICQTNMPEFGILRDNAKTEQLFEASTAGTLGEVLLGVGASDFAYYFICSLLTFFL